MTDIAALAATKMSGGARLGRLLELLGAAVLVGGLAAAGAIGWLAFNSPEVLSRDEAGRFMAKVFERSLWVELGAFFLAVGPRRIRARLAGRGVSWGASAVLLVGLFCLTSHVTLGTSMRRLREAHGGSISSLPADDPDRREFGKLHGLYNLAALGLLGCGLAVLASREAA